MLLEELSAMKTTQKIKVGAKNRYFFCGTVAEFCGGLEEYNSKMKEATLKNYAKVEKKRNKVLEHPPTLTRFVNAELKEPTPNLSVDRFNSLVERWFVACLAIESEYQKAKGAYETYIDLADRNVIEISDSSYDRDTKNIIIGGNEVGQFWDFSEITDSPFGLVGGFYEPM